MAGLQLELVRFKNIGSNVTASICQIFTMVLRDARIIIQTDREKLKKIVDLRSVGPIMPSPISISIFSMYRQRPATILLGSTPFLKGCQVIQSSMYLGLYQCSRAANQLCTSRVYLVIPFVYISSELNIQTPPPTFGPKLWLGTLLICAALKMSITPGRTAVHNNNENLTPVRFLDSPLFKSSSDDANCAAAKSRLDAIIPLLQSNYNKWQLAQKRGTFICTSIEAIKTRALEAKEPAAETLYPNDLRPYVDKLIVIVSIFEDVNKSTRESFRQLLSLSKLPGIADKVFYRSWKIAEYTNFLHELSTYYNRETKVKQYVARELPHCMNRSDLIRCTTAWEYPQNIDEWTLLMFSFLNEEIRCGNKK